LSVLRSPLSDSFFMFLHHAPLTIQIYTLSLHDALPIYGKYSICETFDNEQGNIYYERMQHTWQNGKCTYCGASQEVYDRDEALRSEEQRLNSSHVKISYAVFCLKKKKKKIGIAHTKYRD